MQENKEPDKPEEPKGQGKISPEAEEPSVSEDIPNPEFEEQEEIPPEAEEPSVSEDIPNPEFEEQEGEVLPPAKRKGRGCGFFLFILLFFTSGIGYLYYIDQIPRQIKKQIEPLLKPLKQQFAKFKSESPSRNSKKSVSELENQTPDPPIKKEIKKNPPPNEEHISGFQVESTPKVEKGVPGNTAKISGNFTQIQPESETLVKKSEVEIQVPEPETGVNKTEIQVRKAEIQKHGIKTEKEDTPPALSVMTPTPPSSKRPAETQIQETAVEEKPVERSEAVQAYLDFVESTLVKAGELIKYGFSKGKDFLMKSLG